MAPIRNGALVYAKIPPENQYPVPNEHLVFNGDEVIDLDNIRLQLGNTLVKILYASLDPYHRAIMRSPDDKSYSEALKVGQRLPGGAIGVIVKSNNPQYRPGQHVLGLFDFQEYVITNKSTMIFPLPEVKGVPWSAYLGVLGMPGQSAWMALKEYADMKKGETLFVTTAAGAVGSAVVQLGKLAGLKVIASSGSDEKVAWTKELGADVAFNYKTENTAEILKKEGPIDVFWDNVGGETLEAAIANMNTHGRLVECGMASMYNDKPYAIRNLMLVIAKRLKIFGFLVGDLMPKYQIEFMEDMVPRVTSGEIKFQEYIVDGLENGPQGFDDLLRGKNTGKVVIKVAKD